MSGEDSPQGQSFPVEINHEGAASKLSYVVGPTTLAFPGTTIGRALQLTCHRLADQEALVSVEQDLRFTWRELEVAVDSLAEGLLQHGLRRGDRIAIWAMNCAEWVILQMASAKVGMILVTINPAFRVEELRHVLGLVNCSAFFIGPAFKGSEFGAMLDEVRTQKSPDPALAAMLTVGMAGGACEGCIFWSDILTAGGNQVDSLSEAAVASVSDTDPVNIQFTSGTTGSPKGVTLSHRNILNNAWFVGRGLQIESGDRLCLPVPLFHCFGMVTGVLMCVSHGATLVLPGPAFDPLATILAVERERCTTLYGVPTMYRAMLNHPQFCESGFAAMRTGIMAGSLCPEVLIEDAMNRMNIRDIAICYGMTEAPVSFQTCMPDPYKRRLDSVGRIQPFIEAKLIDETGETVSVGNPGEICVRGYNTMIGYWGNETATRSTIDEDGWLRTGDLGTLDASGYLRIVGRLKDMVIRGGENLYPKEIEDFLHRHDGILDVQVFGVRDELFGEELCAWIIPAPDGDLDEAGVRTYCKDKIAHHKVPRYIRFVESFPMTASGKVQKAVLKAMMEQELSRLDATGGD